ncbi:MAG: T9SS type A sorting domain-containing protein [Bacteroidota bacterium]
MQTTRIYFNTFICLALAIILNPTATNAQITINENVVSDYIGTTYREVLYETNTGIGNQLISLINANGANQTWDFSDLNYIDSTVWFESLQMVDPEDPNLEHPNLAGSTLLWTSVFPPIPGSGEDTTRQLRYGTLQNGQWIINGTVTMIDLDFDGEPEPFVQWFDPAIVEGEFPVTVGSEWTNQTNLTQTFGGMEQITASITDTNTVQGYGTLITPQGTVDALLLRQLEIDQVPGFPFQETNTTLSFITASNQLGASIVLADERAFYSRRSIIEGGNPSSVITPVLHLRLSPNYPNPFRHSTTITFELTKAENVSARIIDLNGKVVQEFPAKAYPAGFSTFLWDAQNMPSGPYVLELSTGYETHQKIVQKM